MVSRIRYSVVFSVALSITLLTINSSYANEPTGSWLRFRGENGTGIVSQCNVPIPWQQTDIAWTIPLAGGGNGSPVIKGEQIYIQSADANTGKRNLMCIDAKSGKQLWQKSEPLESHRMHRRSSYASPTPCIGDDAIYVVWGAPSNITVKSYSLDGSKENWSVNLGSFQSQHGYGASPALFGDTLVLFNSQQGEQLRGGQQPGESSVIALNANTGKRIWETPRTTRRVCYGVPTQYTTIDGKDALLFSNTGDGLFALELKTGAPMWNQNVFQKRCVSCPLAVAGLAIGTEGSGGGGNILYAVDLEGEHEVKFRINRSAPYVPTPVVKDNLMFLWDDNGVVSCVELPNGKTLWSQRTGSAPVSSSPVIAGEKLIGIAEDGTLTVLAASSSFRELGSIQLNDMTRATPLVSKDFLLVRTDSKLICIGNP
ncbi:MAG: PQQ-binding-like beta-propeller repeat protein [Planctomycetota bacterium]